MAENEKIELPPKYYLGYFNYVLDFVKDKYKSILSESEWRFLRKYYALPEDAQCWYIRFLNRKGLIFRTNNLQYEELSTLAENLPILLEKGFIENLAPHKHQQYLHDILAVLNKNELFEVFNEKKIKPLKKAEATAYLLQHFDANFIINQIIEQIPLIKLNFEFETAFIRYLFFGNRFMDMTEFVVRDLGFIKYYQHDDDKLVARFQNRKEAEDKWIITDYSLLFDELKKTEELEALNDWFWNTYKSLEDISEVALPTLDRFILKTAQFFEKKKSFEKSIDIYQLTKQAPARERRLRCLQKLGFHEEALALCEEMIATPLSPDEHFFAIDFKDRVLLKNRKNKKITTSKLHQAQSITISEEYWGQVELGAINHFLKEGKNAAFAENYLWRAIFGLIFWDIIFDPTLVAFHHPFQRRPSDMYLPDFYEKRADKINLHLDLFTNETELLSYMGQQFEKNKGLVNPFVVWLDEIWDMTRVSVAALGLEKIKAIMLHIATNIVEHSRGFPDIFVWDENGYEFIEIKSPTDNLSNRQLFWLQYFEENNINASVLRVFFENQAAKI